MPYVEKEQLHETPEVKKKIGRIILKGGQWNADHTKCEPYDIIEGYVLESSYNMLKEREEFARQESIELRKQIVNLREGNKPDAEVESHDYLNLMLDIKRIEKVIRRLDKRMRKSKDTDVMVRCANALGLLHGKKLLLIQAVTHAKRSHI